jgi:hypothetical protein
MAVDTQGRLAAGRCVVLKANEVGLLRLLRLHEMTDLVCGSRSLPTTVAEWKRHILVAPIAEEEEEDDDDDDDNTDEEEENTFPPQLLSWFWSAFATLDKTQRGDLVEFVTCSRLPSLLGKDTFYLCFNKHAHTDGLPIARTCFRQLHLPRYSSRDSCRMCLVRLVELHRAAVVNKANHFTLA